MTIKTRKKKIASSKDVFVVIKALLNAGDIYDLDKEHLYVLGLDTKSRIKYVDLVSLGTLSSSLAHPREIFRFAISQAVSALIVAHNHPSGDPTPSNTDDDLTIRLTAAGRLLGITVMDHVIVGDDAYYSYVDKDKL